MKRPHAAALAPAFVALAVLAPLRAQDAKPQPAFGISFNGFVRTDILYDSRQTVSLREGHFLLFPKGPLPDREGADINAKSTFHMLAIQTRLTGKITGPDALGAKTSALLEGEFFGHSDPDINGFRLRHAYLKMSWSRTELLVGQYWHPLFVTESFPDVVSFNTGAPFEPFNRSPQVRLTRAFGRWSVAATALSQRDFTSTGPEGPSAAYIRNAAFPELNLKAQFAAGDPTAGRGTLAGAGIDYLKIVPRIVTEAGFKTDTAAAGWTATAFAKRRETKWTIKAQAVYGRNTHHLTMLGGYGVDDVLDPVKRTVDYAPLATASGWLEIQTNGTVWQTGLFAGYSKNLGAAEDLAGPFYARGPDIDAVYRVAPRLVFNAGKIRFAGEAEWTAASYGTPDARGRVRNGKFAGNMRGLVAAYYFF